MDIDYFKYADGLVPAIVQDDQTAQVLMLGFMNPEALAKTQASGRVTFFSRSKKRLWTKGEESGHFLLFRSVSIDCDGDTLLVRAHPLGPVCHTGTDTCWGEKNEAPGFLPRLEATIADRINVPSGNSYVRGLYDKGINKIAQKVGEEAVELVIESKDDDSALFLGEAADLLFHFLILLQAKGHNLQAVTDVLASRHVKPIV